MIDLIFDLLGDAADFVVDLFTDAATDIDWGGLIGEVVSTGLLVAATITVVNLTADVIRSQLNNRQELKSKGVKSAVVLEFIEKSGYTEVNLAALNEQNQQVGTFKMQGKSVSGLKKGDKIYV